MESPVEIKEYINKHALSFGRWYCGGNRPSPIQLTGYKFDPYWGWSLVFSDKTKYRCSLPFWWNEAEPIKEVNKYSNLQINKRKEHDSEYYKLKLRHEILCKKKLELMTKGKNKLMRNAYINQELELIRSKLSEYK
jgi:hypothetical protein